MPPKRKATSGPPRGGKRRFGGRRTFRRNAKKGYRMTATPKQTAMITIVREIAPIRGTVASGTTQVAGGNYFVMNQIPNWAQYTALFDQYRILRVLMSWRLCGNPDAYAPPNVGTVNQNTFYPDFYAAVDHDDINLVANATEILRKDKVKTALLKPNYWTTYSCRPTPLTQIYDGLTQTGYQIDQSSTGKWLDCAQADIPHYGIKWLVDCGTLTGGTNLTQAFAFEYKIKYWVQFKGPQ